MGKYFSERFSEVELEYVRKLMRAKAAWLRLSWLKAEAKRLLQNV